MTDNATANRILDALIVLDNRLQDIQEAIEDLSLTIVESDRYRGEWAKEIDEDLERIQRTIRYRP